MKALLENRVLKAGVIITFFGIALAHSDHSRISDFGLIFCGAGFVFLIGGLLEG